MHEQPCSQSSYSQLALVWVHAITGSGLGHGHVLHHQWPFVHEQLPASTGIGPQSSLASGSTDV
jgi:hypothetical protein